MFGALVLILFFAFLATEGIVEYFLGQLFQHVTKLTPYQWVLMYFSAAVGVGLSIFYKLDLVALLSQYLQMSPPILPGAVGEVVTGLAIGRGASFIHDLLTQFFPPKS